MPESINQSVLLDSHPLSTCLIVIGGYSKRPLHILLPDRAHAIARPYYHYVLVVLEFGTEPLDVNAAAARWRGTPSNKVLLVERVLHVDDLDLQPSNQLIDLDRGLLVCFLLLHLDGRPNNGLLLAADFSFEYLDALLVLVKLTKSLLVHALYLAHHILICKGVL